jgi:hypothetical protein
MHQLFENITYGLIATAVTGLFLIGMASQLLGFFGMFKATTWREKCVALMAQVFGLASVCAALHFALR